MDKKFFHSKKILVTGASGIIGLNLCLFLKDSGAEIHVNYLNQLVDPIKELLQYGFTHHCFDICDKECIAKLDEYDIIFHCSGYGQPQKFTKNPEKTFLLNTDSLVSLVSKVKQGGKFVFFSSSELYVNSKTTNEDEVIGVDPKNTRNCYILGKLCGEYLLELASKKRGIDFKNIRACLVFGEYFKRSDTRVLTELIFKALIKKNISLMDDGSAVRRYLYIKDAIDMIIKIVKDGRRTTYNIGGKEEVSVLDIAKKISQRTGATITIGENCNRLQNSPAFAGVSIERYEKEFGEITLTDIQSGINDCIEWAKTLLKSPGTMVHLDGRAAPFLKKYADVIADIFKNTGEKVIGAEFGVAYGGSLRIIGEAWINKGIIYGFDTFEGHPWLDCENEEEALCMDIHYKERGEEGLSFESQSMKLQDLGLDNVVLKKGLISDDSLDDVPYLNLAILDLDYSKSMDTAWKAVIQKIRLGGIIIMHDCIEGSLNRGWYLSLSLKENFREIAYYGNLGYVVLQRI